MQCPIIASCAFIFSTLKTPERTWITNAEDKWVTSQNVSMSVYISLFRPYAQGLLGLVATILSSSLTASRSPWVWQHTDSHHSCCCVFVPVLHCVKYLDRYIQPLLRTTTVLGQVSKIDCTRVWWSWVKHADFLCTNKHGTASRRW